MDTKDDTQADSSNKTQTQDNVRLEGEKLTIKEKNINNAPTTNANKTEAIDQDTLIANLINQRLQEMKNAGKSEGDPQSKDMDKRYKSLLKLNLDNFNLSLNSTERLKKLYDATNELIDYGSALEENAYIYNKLTNQSKLDKEMINQESIKLANYKTKLEKICRDFQNNNNLIKDANKKYVEEETKRREDLKQNFESSLGEITSKLDEQSKGAQEQHQENEQLRANLKDKIQQFELREKEVLDEIKKRDEENENKTKDILGKLKNIEDDAHAAYTLKTTIDKMEKETADTKIKIILYSDRFPEFENTYRTTYDMQLRFKQEILKTASRMKTFHNQHKVLKQKNDKIDGATIEIVSENSQLKKRIEEAKLAKDKARNRCIELQKELKERDKELQELQKVNPQF